MTFKIPLSEGLFAFVDEDDAEKVSLYKWRATKRGHTYYAYAAINRKTLFMHRFLLLEPSQFIDHKDGNGLNNIRSNIRICTHAENMRNTRKRINTASKYKGLSFSNNKWRVSIEQNGERLFLGSFDDELAAAYQYDRAARLLFGKFAKTNENMGLIEPGKCPVKKQKKSIKSKTAYWRSEMASIGINPRLAKRAI